MRLLHGADWHLGRVLHGAPLIEDQAHALDQLVAIAADTRPDAVIIAGDVYDRAVPPPEAVELLDDTLARLVLGHKLLVIVIAGNHDSPRRLGFGARLLAHGGLHVFGPCQARPAPLILSDAHGPVAIHALAHAEPAVVRAVLADETPRDHDQAFAARLADLAPAPAGARRVLAAHAFVAGGLESLSERPLSVGGSGAVALERFGGFDYVALGHLHRPQQVSGVNARYAGSLLKYSFSEVDQPKSLSLVELDAAGLADVGTIAIEPLRDARIIGGRLEELLADPPATGRQDYLRVELHNLEPVIDAIGRLRAVYPNVLQVTRPHLAAAPDQGQIDPRRLDDAQIFAAFYRQTTGQEATPAMLEAFAAEARQLRRQEREAF